MSTIAHTIPLRKTEEDSLAVIRTKFIYAHIYIFISSPRTNFLKIAKAGRMRLEIKNTLQIHRFQISVAGRKLRVLFFNTNEY